MPSSASTAPSSSRSYERSGSVALGCCTAISAAFGGKIGSLASRRALAARWRARMRSTSRPSIDTSPSSGRSGLRASFRGRLTLRLWFWTGAGWGCRPVPGFAVHFGAAIARVLEFLEADADPRQHDLVGAGHAGFAHLALGVRQGELVALERPGPLGERLAIEVGGFVRDDDRAVAAEARGGRAGGRVALEVADDELVVRPLRRHRLGLLTARDNKRDQQQDAHSVSVPCACRRCQRFGSSGAL